MSTQRFACSHLCFRASEVEKNPNYLNDVEKVSWQWGLKKLRVRVVISKASLSQNRDFQLFYVLEAYVQTES